jgi:hypothetical protein
VVLERPAAMANDEWSSLLARPLGELIFSNAGEVEATIKGAFGHEPSHTFSAGPSRLDEVEGPKLYRTKDGWADPLPFADGVGMSVFRNGILMKISEAAPQLTCNMQRVAMRAGPSW